MLPDSKANVMSRNLCKVECDRCNHHPVKLLEQPRPVTEDDTGRYFDEFDSQNLTVAEAVCPVCNAHYLAWCSIEGPYPREPLFEEEYFDLSYLSTFNDEPGEYDLPMPDAIVVLNNLRSSIGQQKYNEYKLDVIENTLRALLRHS